MLKVLSNKVFSFSRGERDSRGHLLRNKTIIGFCDLPDWVADTDLYKMAVKEGSIQPVNAMSKSENYVKANEEIEALRAEIEDLKQQKLLLSQELPSEEPEVIEEVEVKRGRKPSVK